MVHHCCVTAAAVRYYVLSDAKKKRAKATKRREIINLATLTLRSMKSAKSEQLKGLFSFYISYVNPSYCLQFSS